MKYGSHYNDLYATGQLYYILTIEDLAVVTEEIGEESSKWYNIGLQLGLHAGVLDSIRESEHYDSDRCLTSTLKKWLRSADLQPSWSNLAKALRAKTVGLGQLANQICPGAARGRKYTL